jgi:hypothetical protein
MAQSYLTYLLKPIAGAMVDNSESPIDDIPQISPIPLLVVHGTKDRVLNYSLGKRIFDLAQEPKEFWSIPDGQHLEFMFREEGKYGAKFFDRVDLISRYYKAPPRKQGGEASSKTDKPL